MLKIVQAVKDRIPPARLTRTPSLVVVHAFFTAVRSYRLGLSMTLTDQAIFPGAVHSVVRHMGKIETCSLDELLSWTESPQPIERSVGMAALNSCLPFTGLSFFEGNALDLAAEWGRGKHVVIVGHFPHLERIKSTARRMDILEKRPQPGDLPAEEAARVIPQADVVAMTGVTCLNDTIEELLSYKKPGARFIALGPTIPLSPVLFEAGVDVVGGAWVDDENTALPMMAQGATARVLQGIRYVLLPRDPALLAGFTQIAPPPEAL
jgi:hypothetical protein